MKLVGMIFVIALTITLPLMKFYQRTNWTKKQSIINILLLSFLCFLIHAPLHEFCHFIGAKLMNVEIIDYQFFSKLSFKNFQSAYITTSSRTANQAFIIRMAPYIKDITFAFVSFLILKRKQINSSFLVGLIFSIGLLLSAFNIFENLLLGYPHKIGDWYELSKTIGHFWTWIIGIIMLGTILFLIYRIFKIYKGFPEKMNLEVVSDTNKGV